MERIYDAKDCIIGRVAVKAAKAALLGDTVSVINCEKAVISGKRESVFADIDSHFRRVGQPTKGPFMQHNSDRFVRRIITRMLPRSTARGREAMARVLCYTGVPKAFEGKTVEHVPGADKGKLPNYYYVTVQEICKRVGGKR
jgi:large subunit ribosomal protein L13